jgi:hypothetical protein
MEVMRDDFPLAKVDEPYHTAWREQNWAFWMNVFKSIAWHFWSQGARSPLFGCLGAIQVIWMLVRRMLATFLGNAAKSWEQKLASISCEHSASQTLMQILDRPGGSR